MEGSKSGLKGGLLTPMPLRLIRRGLSGRHLCWQSPSVRSPLCFLLQWRWQNEENRQGSTYLRPVCGKVNGSFSVDDSYNRKTKGWTDARWFLQKWLYYHPGGPMANGKIKIYGIWKVQLSDGEYEKLASHKPATYYSQTITKKKRTDEIRAKRD